MPDNARGYLPVVLIGAAAILLVAGLVLFVAAISFEGYIAALMAIALAGCCYFGARELKAKEARAENPPGTDTPP